MTKPSIPLLSSLALLLLGGACLAAFNLIGSRMDAQGFVHEPFGLLPIGWFLICVGFVVGLAGIAQAAWRRRGG